MVRNSVYAILIHSKPSLNKGWRGGVARIGASKMQRPTFYAVCRALRVCAKVCIVIIITTDTTVTFVYYNLSVAWIF